MCSLVTQGGPEATVGGVGVLEPLCWQLTAVDT